jgi:hypothetical protein
MALMNGYDTVFTAALTSAGVALAIEWAAKPRLEVRKERILRESQAKREIKLQLGLIISVAAFLDADISQLDAQQRRTILAAQDERRAEVVSASRLIEQALAVVLLKTDLRTRGVIAHAIGRTQGIAMSDKLRSQAGAELAFVSTLALDLYHAPKWHFRKRRKLFAAADILSGATPLPSS